MDKSIVMLLMGVIIMMFPFWDMLSRIRQEKKISGLIVDEMTVKYGLKVRIIHLQMQTQKETYANGWYCAIVESDGKRFNVYVRKEDGAVKDDYKRHLLK
ncbi:MAG: hypothetical protein E7289_06465 [Lachnospiraceae bacterium]|nr:hypothetical protein [Lachnospiraceae bacterium]